MMHVYISEGDPAQITLMFCLFQYMLECSLVEAVHSWVLLSWKSIDPAIHSFAIHYPDISIPFIRMFKLKSMFDK